MNQKPLPLDNPLLNSEAWEEWLIHRKEKRNPVKPGSIAERKQVKLLCTLSHEEQQEVVDRSMIGGYTGLFPPKQDKKGDWDAI